MMNASCHCGAVRIKYDGVPARLVSCNCSICRRLRPLWAHGPQGKLQVISPANATTAYIWGDKSLAFHSCKICGVTTHWMSLGAETPQNMALNFALMDDAQIRDIPIRHFDGNDTFTFFRLTANWVTCLPASPI